MTDGLEPKVDQIEINVESTISRAEHYARAFQELDPRLSVIEKEKDLAVGFDVGEGADGIAFTRLGFKKFIVTNSPSALHALYTPTAAQLERDTLIVIQRSFPPGGQISSLSVMDFLNRQNFQARLITMVCMAPQYFKDDGGDPASFLKRLVQIHNQLQPNSTVILSAYNDHELSDYVFRAADKLLTEQNVSHQLLLDNNIPLSLGYLGQRILTIKK